MLVEIPRCQATLGGNGRLPKPVSARPGPGPNSDTSCEVCVCVCVCTGESCSQWVCAWCAGHI